MVSSTPRGGGSGGDDGSGCFVWRWRCLMVLWLLDMNVKMNIVCTHLKKFSGVCI